MSNWINGNRDNNIKINKLHVIQHIKKIRIQKC